jgi:hypothetical protein
MKKIFIGILFLCAMSVFGQQLDEQELKPKIAGALVWLGVSYMDKPVPAGSTFVQRGIYRSDMGLILGVTNGKVSAVTIGEVSLTTNAANECLTPYYRYFEEANDWTYTGYKGNDTYTKEGVTALLKIQKRDDGLIVSMVYIYKE